MGEQEGEGNAVVQKKEDQQQQQQQVKNDDDKGGGHDNDKNNNNDSKSNSIKAEDEKKSVSDATAGGKQQQQEEKKDGSESSGPKEEKDGGTTTTTRINSQKPASSLRSSKVSFATAATPSAANNLNDSKKISNYDVLVEEWLEDDVGGDAADDDDKSTATMKSADSNTTMKSASSASTMKTAATTTASRGEKNSGNSNSNANKYILCEDRHHVGNRRLEVFLNMFRKEFEDTLTAGESTHGVVHKIVDIVCNKCVPRGRFLRKQQDAKELHDIPEGDNENEDHDGNNKAEDSTSPANTVVDAAGTVWSVLPVDTVHVFILDLLQNAREHEIRAARRCRRGFAGMMEFGPPRLQHQTSTGSSASSVASGNSSVATTASASTSATAASSAAASSKMMTDESDSDKKRRRRSSLLRRSISESMLLQCSLTEGSDNAADGPSRKSPLEITSAPTTSEQRAFERRLRIKKKAVKLQTDGDSSSTTGSDAPVSGKGNRAPKQDTSASLSVASRAAMTGVTVVPQANPLDIIFNETRTALIPRHTGNNRLLVLLQMQHDKYTAASIEGRQSCIQDLVLTVTKHWKGRFLRVLPQAPKSGGGTSSGKTKEPTTYLQLNSDQAETTLQTLLGSFTIAPPTFLSSATSGSVAARSIPVIPPSAAGVDVAGMRSAAISSLQKRKQRQAMANKIRNLAANNRAGNTSGNSNAAGAGGAAQAQQLTRAVSEPVKTTNKPKVAAGILKNNRERSPVRSPPAGLVGGQHPGYGQMPPAGHPPAFLQHSQSAGPLYSSDPVLPSYHHPQAGQGGGPSYTGFSSQQQLPPAWQQQTSQQLPGPPGGGLPRLSSTSSQHSQHSQQSQLSQQQQQHRAPPKNLTPQEQELYQQQYAQHQQRLQRAQQQAAAAQQQQHGAPPPQTAATARFTSAQLAQQMRHDQHAAAQQQGEANERTNQLRASDMSEGMVETLLSALDVERPPKGQQQQQQAAAPGATPPSFGNAHYAKKDDLLE